MTAIAAKIGPTSSLPFALLQAIIHSCLCFNNNPRPGLHHAPSTPESPWSPMTPGTPLGTLLSILFIFVVNSLEVAGGGPREGGPPGWGLGAGLLL